MAEPTETMSDTKPPVVTPVTPVKSEDPQTATVTPVKSEDPQAATPAKKKVYRDEVLGLYVLIEFLIDVNRRAWFRGQILKFQMSYSPRGNDPKIEHFVRFDDGDERWFALAVEEEMGRLQWTTASSSSTTAATTPPARKGSSNIHKRSSPTSAPGPKRIKMEESDDSGLEESSPEDEEDDDEEVEVEEEEEVLPYEERVASLAKESETEWMDDMRNWLETVPHGRVKKVVSPSNASKVMSQVSKLVHGKGISYKNWPSAVCFYGGTRINLSHDFDKLLKIAKDFEVMYGEDKGHGWLLRHPIQKMGLYKDYRLKHT